jgi:hypothetical protein
VTVHDVVPFELSSTGTGDSSTNIVKSGDNTSKRTVTYVTILME